MRSRWVRGALAGLAGGVAWIVGMTIAFLPAQAILTDPALQSAKMMAAFAPGEAAARTYAAPWILPAGVLAIGVLWGWVYVGIAPAWSGAWWRRGLLLALVGWALMVPWFEFYLPWNVLLEPAPLVVLELACWAVVLLFVGVAVAGTEALLRRLGRVDERAPTREASRPAG